jgi:hypothetical protein
MRRLGRLFRSDIQAHASDIHRDQECVRIARPNEAKNVIVIDAGAGSIEFWTLDGGATAGRSRKYHLVAIDEAAFGGDDLADIYSAAITPTPLDYEGRVVVASTPNGIDPGNFFWRVNNQAALGFLPGVFHAPSHRNPMLPRAELTRLEKQHPPLVYRQEFLAEFVDLSGTALFSIAACLREDGRPFDVPDILDTVFAVIDSGIKGGREHDATAAVYFGINLYTDPGLYVLGWEAVEVGANSIEEWFRLVAGRLVAYGDTSRLRLGVRPVYVEPAGLGEVLLAKFPADTEAIGTKLVARGKDLRALEAVQSINGGKVRIAAEAFDHTCSLKGVVRNHFIAQLASFRVGDKDAFRRADDLLDCATYGTILAFGGET